jgi:ATP-binding cassette subfamily C protein
MTLDDTTRASAVVLLILVIVGTVLEGAGIASVFVLISVIGDPATISKFGILGQIADRYALEGNLLITTLSIGIAAFIIFKNSYLYIVICYRVSFVNDGIARDGKRLLSRYLDQTYEQFIQRNSADYIRNTFISVRSVHAGIFTGFIEFITESLVAITILIITLVAEPVAASIAFAFVGTVFLVIYQFLGRRMTRLGEERHFLEKEVLQNLNQSLNNFRDIQLYYLGQHFIRTFAELISSYTQNYRSYGILTQTPRLVFESVLPIGIVTVVVVAVLSNDKGNILPLLALFAVSAMRILPSFNRIVMSVNGIKSGFAALNEIAPDLSVKSARSTNLGNNGAANSIKFDDVIELEGVGYGYDKSLTKRVVKNISVKIRCGQSVGLVGVSGAGKSTVADLLLGLLRPDAGRILIDGKDITDHMREWQHLLGVVPQSINFLDDTLRRNVAIGIDDADINEADLEEALSKAQLQETIKNLPDGLDTNIGERGVKLSGGQRQRVGIARALDRKPKVLILDEATSALDLETEWEVNQSIKNLHGQVTLIVIAHRLSTVRDCSKLIYLDGGVIIDEGTYDELYQRCAPFTRLVDRGEFSGENNE